MDEVQASFAVGAEVIKEELENGIAFFIKELTCQALIMIDDGFCYPEILGVKVLCFHWILNALMFPPPRSYEK